MERQIFGDAVGLDPALILAMWHNQESLVSSIINFFFKGGELLLRHAPDGLQCVHPWVHTEDPGQTYGLVLIWVRKRFEEN